MHSKNKQRGGLAMRSGSPLKYTTTAGTLLSEQMERINKMVVEIVQQTRALTKKDLGDWRQAWQMAVNVDNPARRFLYDIYSDVEVDLHLTGCTGQRKGFVCRKAFRLIDIKTGKENQEVSEYFEAEWFKDLVDYYLDSRYWGHTLVELGVPVTNSIGKPMYSYVRLVPRKHVVPEFGVILEHETDLWQSGYDYRNSNMSQWIIESGRRDNLGLFLRCAQQTIPKKNMLAFWDQFGEIFGMPIRIAHTTSTDKNTQSRIENMLTSMGAAAWGLFPEGTEVDIKESTKGDAFNVYDQRIERANSEVSKGILLQTMTIDNGASLSQGQVHYEIFQNVIDQDADYVRDMVNNQLIPRMVAHGFPVEGYRFDWDDSVDYTPEQRKSYEELILNHYKVNPKYFIDTYNVPIIGEREAQPSLVPAELGDNGEKPEKKEQEEQENRIADKVSQKLMAKLDGHFFA